MSLLIDLLQKIKKGRAVREVSPLVERASQRPPARRWTYLVVVIGAVLSVAAGFMVVRLFHEKRPVTLQKTIVIAKRKEPIKQISEVKTKSKKTPPISHKIKEIKKLKKREKVSSNSLKKLPNSAKKRDTKKHRVLKKQKALSKKRTPDRHSTPADYYLYQAIKAEKEGHLYNAINLYKRVLKQENKNPGLLNKLSYLYIKVKSPEEALSYAKEALKLNPSYVDATINLSVALIMTGRLDEAVENLKRAYRQNPDDRRLLYNLALLYEKKGQFDRAGRLYERLYQFNDLRGVLGLARIRERRGDIKGAIRYYSEALKKEGLTEAQRMRLKRRLSILSRALN